MGDDLTEITAEIRGWLDLKMVTGRYSSGLVTELSCHVKGRTSHFFLILDEIGNLEGAPGAKPTNTKLAAPFEKPPLAGLWHKHYFQPQFMVRNILNHWTPKRLRTRSNEILKDVRVPAEKKAEYLTHVMVTDGYFERSQVGDLTGEWIVFARQDDMNYYLTLGVHGDDVAIQRRVMACCGEFPELDISNQLVTGA